MVTVLERVRTNGQNGHLSDETRKGLVALAIFGAPSDAMAAFLAVPGTSLEAWQEFDRALAPVRAYVRDGEQPYVQPLTYVDLWQGVQTPQGDCAEDAMPLESANPARRATERQWFESRKGE